MALSQMDAVHAITDVTGFGLAGHLLEICRGSGLTAQLHFDSLPCIPVALEIAQSGICTGASPRNWSGYGGDVALPAGFADWKRNLLTDPQTSGGLLITCASDAVEPVLAILKAQHFEEAAVIGHLQKGPALMQVI